MQTVLWLYAVSVLHPSDIISSQVGICEDTTVYSYLNSKSNRSKKKSIWSLLLKKNLVNWRLVNSKSFKTKLLSFNRYGEHFPLAIMVADAELE